MGRTHVGHVLLVGGGEGPLNCNRVLTSVSLAFQPNIQRLAHLRIYRLDSLSVRGVRNGAGNAIGTGRGRVQLGEQWGHEQPI